LITGSKLNTWATLVLTRYQINPPLVGADHPPCQVHGCFKGLSDPALTTAPSKTYLVLGFFEWDETRTQPQDKVLGS